MKLAQHSKQDFELVQEWRVQNYWRFTDRMGNRWWPSDWGPRPSMDDKTPPRRVPYSD